MAGQRPCYPLPHAAVARPRGGRSRIAEGATRAGPAWELTTTVAPVIITDLPDHLHEATVELWSATGLTRPWNDPEPTSTEP